MIIISVETTLQFWPVSSSHPCVSADGRVTAALAVASCVVACVSGAGSAAEFSVYCIRVQICDRILPQTLPASSVQVRLFDRLGRQLPVRTTEVLTLVYVDRIVKKHPEFVVSHRLSVQSSLCTLPETREPGSMSASEQASLGTMEADSQAAEPASQLASDEPASQRASGPAGQRASWPGREPASQRAGEPMSRHSCLLA